MIGVFPNAREEAAREAAHIREDRDMVLRVPLERALGDSAYVDRGQLLEGLAAFHKERMAKEPSSAVYPESVFWVKHVREVDRQVQELARVSDQDMAVLRSLHAYLTFRGFARARPATVEKCRVVYAPESDNGQLHIKNVDDPATHWKGLPPCDTMPLADADLVWDGVGSGMHMDDEPPEIFPLPITRMYRHYAGDVPSTVQFLTRYASFWGGQNIVLHDRAKRSVRIDKSSYNYIEVYQPGSDGCSHCSGMACQELDSPQARYLKSKRQQFLAKNGIPEDCTENAFWNACDRAEAMLAASLKGMGGQVVTDAVIDLFTTPWPKGLNKTGALLHPKQPVAEYTLYTQMVLMDKPVCLRWARDAVTLAYPDKPWVMNPKPVPFKSRFS